MTSSGLYARNLHNNPIALGQHDLNRLVAVIRQACKFTPSKALLQSLELCKDILDDSLLQLRGYRCSFLLIYLLEGILFLVGRQFVLTPETIQAKDHVVELLHVMFTKITLLSMPLSDQLVAILAQSVFSFRQALPVEGVESDFLQFAKFASINVSKKLLRREVFESLFVVCTQEFVLSLVDLIYHYCCVYDTTRKSAVSLSILQCLAIYGDQDVLEHYYLQEW